MSNSFEKTVVVDKCNDCGFYRMWNGNPVCVHSMNPSKSTVDRMHGMNMLEHEDYKKVPIPDSCPLINRDEIEADSDLLIKIKSEDGKIRGHDMEIFVSEDGKYKQIGFIHRLEIIANIQSLYGRVEVIFPHEVSEDTEKIISENSSLLASKGCRIIREETPG